MKQLRQRFSQLIRHRSPIFLFILLPCLLLGQVEICDNGLDDDNDNLIDLNDDDCMCEVIEPVSLIPNPSFEEMDCCPYDRSQLDCADTWIQASEATTDYLHTCGWTGWDEFPPPQPFPDGDGIMGFRDGRVRNNDEIEPYWKEYAGACLLSPLLADVTYRFQFDVGFVNPDRSPPIDISFFGTTSCTHLPFGIGNAAFGCPTNSPNWIKLGEVRVSGGQGNVWVNTFLEITPTEDIFAIAIGPDCSPVWNHVSTYYFFDNLLLADIELFELQISETAHPCSDDYFLSTPYNPNFDYQWYLSGIALEGEVNAELSQNYGEGIYQVRILDGTSCRVSASFNYEIPVFNTPAKIAICNGEEFQFGSRSLVEAGNYLDTFISKNNCDSIVNLELEVIGAKYDTMQAAVLAGETFEIGNYSFMDEGAYSLTFTSSIGCDSFVLLELSNFNVFIPNAFSPNDDGINDQFQVFAADNIIQSVDMKIFDRWGNLLHRGVEWNGSDATPGVFVYLVHVEFSNNTSKQYHGAITLLK